MDIKLVLSKLLKCEAISDEERTFAEGFDFKAQIDGAQASVRKKLEKRIADLEGERDGLQTKVTELEEAAEEAKTGNGTEVEKLSRELDKVKKSLADKDAEVAKSKAATVKLLRDGKVSGILGKLKLVDGIDPETARLALERHLAEVETDDLDDEHTVNPILDKFRTANKALILDESKGGGGTPPKGGPGVKDNEKDPTAMSREEREKDLKTKGII